MGLFNQSSRRQFLIATSATLAGLSLFGMSAFSLNSSEANQLAAARSKWISKSISHYRLSLSYSSSANCQQEVEIQNEKVIAVRKNTCPKMPTMTVPDLFKKVDSIANGKECGPNGCACDGKVGVDAIYDAKLGYPREVKIRLKPENRWLDLGYWTNQVKGSACTAIGFVDQKITVRSFKPVE